jgi:diguanylate cyclase (GGDEF)-like protein
LHIVISLSTIYLCTAIAGLVAAIGLTLQWMLDRREKAPGWWALAMWVGAAAMAMVSTRGVAPNWFSLGLGNAVAMTAYSIAVGGFIVFLDRKPRIPLMFLGAALWLGCYFGSEAFRETLILRVGLLTVLTAACAILTVRLCWQGWQREQLPTFLVAIGVYNLHLIAYAVRMVLGIIGAVTDQNGVIDAPWLPVVGLANFALIITTTFIYLALVKERAERRYRLAAEIDSLTSAHSRRFFVAETRALLAHKPSSGVLAVMDLDYFKSVNDTYGHMAGDKVLESFGRLIKRRLAPGMVFGRLGGEEFGLFMQGMNAPAAHAFLDELRAEVAKLAIPFMGHALKVTASIGAAPIDEVGGDFDHLMAAADNALYVAKEEGRDQVSIFTPSMRLRKIIEADGEESRVSLAKARVSRISVRNTAGQN